MEIKNKKSLSINNKTIYIYCWKTGYAKINEKNKQFKGPHKNINRVATQEFHNHNNATNNRKMLGDHTIQQVRATRTYDDDKIKKSQTWYNKFFGKIKDGQSWYSSTCN